MNRKDIRVTDPVLSKIALGYSNPSMIGAELFPFVDVDAVSGKIIQFGKESFRTMNTRRAPGTKTKRIQVGYESGNYSLVNNGLDASIPREWLRDQKQVPGINMQRQSVETVMQIELNNLEYEQATLARDAARYGSNNKLTLSGTDKWSDHDNSDPIGDVKAAREAIRSSTGRYPNKMTIPANVHNTLCEHPKILAKLASDERKIVTAKDYQDIFDVERVVIGASVIADSQDQFEDVWKNDVILAYVPTVITSKAQPSFGYTYRLKGHPNVEQMWYDRSCKSWIAGVEYERQPLLTGIQSGFLIQSAV